MTKLTQTAAFNPENTKVTKAVTLPVLSQKIKRGETSCTIYAYMAAAIVAKTFQEEVKDTKTGEIKKVDKNTHTANVINCIDQKPYAIVLTAVTLGNLEETYQKQSYVGKCFMIQNKGQKEGKSYNDVTIAEISNQGIDFCAIAESYGIAEAPALKAAEGEKAEGGE